MKKIIIVIFLCTLGFVCAKAQNSVTGTVVSAEDGIGLPGVSISIQGTTGGTITNANGIFTLKIPKNAKKLVASFVGFVSQQIILNGKKDLGTIQMKTDAVGLDEVTVLASIVTDRKTPVSVSTISSEAIGLKLGTQEFPEILKTTPSIYTSKEGGGYGDATVYVRGFDSNNVGVLINGIPVNDMESGKVYWSNWAGLSDVTRTMQIQRGLGASKLGLSSVGGTINILTKSTDAKKGGIVKFGVGPDGYQKQSFSVSTGITKDGWAVTLLGSHTQSDGYINGTNFNAYSYFAEISKRINDQHSLSFMITGAPQWHNQRGNKHTIIQYKTQRDEFKYNSDYGIRDGKVYGGGYGYNEYHKPQAQLNHYWNINHNTQLTTSLYASIGTGYGRRINGNKSSWLTVNYKTGKDDPEIMRTPDGLLDFDAVAKANKTYTAGGSQAIVGENHNDHVWYGLLSNLTHNYKDFKFTAGIDARYYKGKHYQEISDLLGGQFFLDTSKNLNRSSNTWLYVGDKYSYNDNGISRYGGLFGQAEYAADKLTGFLSAAIAQKSYKRQDYFNYTIGNETSDWQNFYPWNVKAGISYKIDDVNTIFANGGYVQRTPYMAEVFVNYTNEINSKASYEKIITAEIGYNLTLPNFNLSFTAYNTAWNDRGIHKTIGQELTNLSGVNELHQGIELTANYHPIKKLRIDGMFSMGNWKYTNNVQASVYDDNQTLKGRFSAYMKDVHVGNSAQTTASLSADYEILPNLRLNADYVYYAKNYADFDATLRNDASFSGDSWKLPDVGLVDLGFNYKFKIAGLNSSLNGMVDNLFDTEYVSKATDGATHSSTDALVYYGFGRTWSTSLSIKF